MDHGRWSCAGPEPLGFPSTPDPAVEIKHENSIVGDGVGSLSDTQVTDFACCQEDRNVLGSAKTESNVEPAPHPSELAGTLDVGRKIPGTNASTTHLSKLWQSLPRSILRSSHCFGFFLHTLLQMPDGQHFACPTAELWPMPLPFPMCFRRGASTDQEPLKKAVSLQVAVLNWIFLGKPKGAPDHIRLGVKLNRAQWSVVDRCMRLSKAWTNFPTIGPEDMGRGASKHEALEEVLKTLETMAASHSAELGYSRGKFSRAVHEPKRNVDVVGRLKSSNLEVAQPIVADRIKMTGKPTFDPRAFLDPRSRALYEDPVSHASAPCEITEPLPIVKVHATYREKMKLYQKLDQTERLAIATRDEVREFAPNGLFTVAKDLSYDRMILDGRRPNKLQPPLNRWIMSMASASNLVDISLEANEVLVMAGDDLRDYYYCFQVNHSRACRNFLAGPLLGSEAKQFKCCPPGVQDSDTVYACLKSLAMGDCSACEFAQTAHLALGIRGRAFRLGQMLSLRGRVPRDRFLAGIIIDDMIFMEKTLKTLQGKPIMSKEAKARIAAMEAQYCAVGLETHSKKSFQDSVEAIFWGSHVDGQEGLVRANPQRVIPMMVIVNRMLQLGVASVGLLETVAGVFISIFSFRRRMFSLLSEVYKLSADLDQKDVIRLSGTLIDELYVCVVLAPMAVTDLRARFSEDLYMTDASDWGEAVVKTRIGATMSKEMLRHSLNKPCWTRLLTPFKALLRTKGVLDAVQEMPTGEVAYVEHPLWETAARCLQYDLVCKKRARGGRHINVGELRAYLLAEVDAARPGGDVRVPISGDSQVCLGAVNKGRSASPALNAELLKSLPFVLGLGIYSFSGFTRTKFNPADDPTRGVPLRLPELEVPNWWSLACRGCFADMDAFLEQMGVSPSQICGLPPVTELLPADVVADGSCFDKSLTQRRKAKVVEKLVRRKHVASTPPAYQANLPWNEEAHTMLMSFPRQQFILRGASCWPPTERGFLDLFSGKKGFARAAVEAGAPWVLCFELRDGADQDLLKNEVRAKIRVLIFRWSRQPLFGCPDLRFVFSSHHTSREKPTFPGWFS